MKMKFQFCSRAIARFRCRRLRRIMRGYRFLRDSKSLSRIGEIKSALSKQPLDIKQKAFSKYIFGENIAQAEIVCRQYLLGRVAGLNLNRVLLYAFGKPGSPVSYYLPPEWRKIIRKQGLKVAAFRTALLWNAFVGMMLAYCVLKIVRTIFDGIKSASNQSNRQLGRYVYFENLAPGDLPQPCKDGRSHDIITWYMQWAGRVVDTDTLCHGVIGSEQREVSGIPVVPVPKPIPPLPHFGSLIRFIVWGIRASLLATWDFLRGRWWHALLLNQATLATQVRLQEPKRLAKEYLFNNSSAIYRPMWTYEAERRGTGIIFYFYSTNNERFKRTEGYPPLNYVWQMMHWPHYLVWDEYQAEFVRCAVGRTAKIDVVGQIWFHDSSEETPVLEGKAIGIFDVTPYRDSRYRILGVELEYYVPKTFLSFLSDIQKAVNDAGYMMLWKRKRKIGSIAHPHYRRFAKQLELSENVIIVNPDISAYRVIEASMAVISMPFTSTALIARELGKPSCYYDSTGLVQKDDRAAHGIEIITGPEALTMWLSSCHQKRLRDVG